MAKRQVWIEVDKRTPPFNYSLWVYNGRHVYAACLESINSRGCEFVAREGDFNTIPDVTHWMRRPEPPATPDPPVVAKLPGVSQ
jgi:hypothetical protein